MDRRDFVQQFAALALGVAGMAALDVDHLKALLPQADPTGTHHVGASDVAVIEDATVAFSRQDFATGSGPVRDIAVASAPSGMTRLTNIQARAHAIKNDAAAHDQALGQSTEHFINIDPISQESMAAFLDEAHFASLQGVTLYELALADRDPRAANRAMTLLRQAVDGFGPETTPVPVHCTCPGLLGRTPSPGDTGTAVSIGHQAVGAISPLHSRRAYDWLRVLNTALQSLHTSADVAELRERLTTTAT